MREVAEDAINAGGEPASTEIIDKLESQLRFERDTFMYNSSHQSAL